MSARIRPATPDDVPTILALIRELAEYEKLTHAMVATDELMRQHLFGPNPAAEVAMLEWSGQSVGYALWFRTFSTFLGRPGIYLEDIYVQPAFRNRGLGRKVFSHLATLCRERHYGRLEWSVLNWNAPSIAFYRSLGAEPLTEWQMMRLTGEALDALVKSTG